MLRLSEDDHARVSARDRRGRGARATARSSPSPPTGRTPITTSGCIMRCWCCSWCWPSSPPGRISWSAWWTRLHGLDRRADAQRELLTLLLGLRAAKFLRGAVPDEVDAAAAGADARLDQDPAGAAAGDDAVQGRRRAADDRPHRDPHLSVDGRASRRNRRRRGDHRGDHARNLGRGDGGAAHRGEGGPAGRRHRRRGRADRRGAGRAFPQDQRPTPTKSPTS